MTALDAQATLDEARRGEMQWLTVRCEQWRRRALVSFGLFMGSVVAIILLILGRI